MDGVWVNPMLQRTSLAAAALGFSLIPLQACAQPIQRSGRFLAAEHPAAGEVRLEQRNGNATLVFSQDFRTTDQAPDLFVVVSPMAMPLENSPAPAYPLTPGTFRVVAPVQRHHELGSAGVRLAGAALSRLSWSVAAQHVAHPGSVPPWVRIQPSW
jgi:hypothetical protein